MDEYRNPAKRRRYSAEERMEILAAYERRTTTQREFCMERGMSMATLYVWRRKRRGVCPERGDFLELPSSGLGGGEFAVALELRGAVSVRIAAGTDPRWLRELFLVLPCGA